MSQVVKGWTVTSSKNGYLRKTANAWSSRGQWKQVDSLMIAQEALPPADRARKLGY